VQLLLFFSDQTLVILAFQILVRCTVAKVCCLSVYKTASETNKYIYIYWSKRFDNIAKFLWQIAKHESENISKIGWLILTLWQMLKVQSC